jgi:glycosyltransferase involved in cell wall biosynthesis
MAEPYFSIVTPSYNQARFVEATLQSVFMQDYPYKEYLVLDGGSTDGSTEIIQRYANRLVYWVSEPDRGQSHAINNGFDRANGNVLGWLNSDDTYLPGTLSVVAQAFIAHPEIDLVYGDYLFTYPEGQPMRRRHVFPKLSYATLWSHDYLGQPAVFFRRELWERVGPLDEDLYYAMDWELFLRMWKVCHPMHISRVLATYRLHPSSKSGAEDSEKSIQAMHLVQQRHAPQRFTLAWLNRAWLRSHYYWSFVLRIWTVLRDNPVSYAKAIHLMFPGRRMLRLIKFRLWSPL